MSISLDGYEVMRKVGANPAAFPAIKQDLATGAETLVRKQIKHKTLDLTGLRMLSNILGEENLRLVLDLFKPKELTALLKKLDKHGSAEFADNATAARRHILDLAHSKTEPAPKPIKAIKPKLPSIPKAPKAASPIGTTAMGTRRGKSHQL